MSEEYEKFLNWCEDKWVLDCRWKKLLSKLSNDDKDFLKDQYEARLKADLIAILTELQSEIKELWDSRYDVWLDNQYYIGKSDTLDEVDEVIQQKINALRGNEDGK